MLKGNIYFFAKENLFSESENTVYINIVGDPILYIYDDVVLKEKDAHVKNSICDDDENNFIKIARISDGHEGPTRCATCKKRVGLTGFKCRSDIHNCSFNYHVAVQEPIAKANPVVKAEKLDKI
ncbi:hypothetical protein BRARA_H00213 [Brassica rapa]|uniref:Uncharacterized protein n=1 Tax=Brassica campestris TaxID=3711 RepID=A0A397Y739_BRACM|nr:hypothetical protein BRARA_H00213 [Brassica rapa]